MIRWFCISAVTISVLGCSGMHDSASEWQHPGSLVGAYNFNWRLSGDPAVAPLHVFSGEGRIWLQFPPGQPLPAIFAKTETGLQPLPYKVFAPYVVLEGNWHEVVLRGGLLVAHAEQVSS